MNTPEPLTPDDENRLLAEGPAAPAYECYARWERWYLGNADEDLQLRLSTLELVEIYAAWAQVGGWEAAMAERGWGVDA